ncbi:MAG: tetratricopeptide repeat protein [Thermoanaerobaculia bacterium]
MGNNPYSYGLFSDPIGLRGNLHQMAKQVQIYTEKEAKKNLSPLEINFYWAKKVFVWAKENPMDFLRNFIFKIQRFMDNWEYGINEQWIWGSPKITYLFPLPFALIISAGIMGLILSIKSKENFPFFLFFLSQLLVLLIFFPSSRHRFPLIPVLCLWSGLFLDRFFSLERRKKIFHLTFFLLILFFSIIGVPDERRKPDPFINYNQSIASLSLGDLEKANYWIEEALKGNWAVPFFHSAKAKIYYLQGKKDKGIREKWYAFYLGESEAQLLNELGKWSLEKKKFKAAERVFKRSVEVYPKSGASAINLAQVLFLQGKREEAKIWYQKGISLGGMPNPYLEKTFKNLEENSKKKN